MKAIDIRRSVRSFKDHIPEMEKVLQMLRAGMQAPSAGNQQPWEFVVVDDSLAKQELSKMSPYAGPVKDAPIVIAVVASKDKMRFPENMQQDLGACTENILLEGVEQGLGTTWFSVFPQEERINCVKNVLCLPDNTIPYNLIIVGYPLHESDNKYIDRFDQTRIFKNKYAINNFMVN